MMVLIRNNSLFHNSNKNTDKYCLYELWQTLVIYQCLTIVLRAFIKKQKTAESQYDKVCWHFSVSFLPSSTDTLDISRIATKVTVNTRNLEASISLSLERTVCLELSKSDTSENLLVVDLYQLPRKASFTE